MNELFLAFFANFCDRQDNPLGSHLDMPHLSGVFCTESREKSHWSRMNMPAMNHGLSADDLLSRVQQGPGREVDISTDHEKDPLIRPAATFSPREKEELDRGCDGVALFGL